MPGAAGSGGYRKPSQPAPVSGPGAGSKRTDGGPAQKLRDLPDAQYGEAATFRSLQEKAPLAQTPSATAPRRSSPGGGGAGSGITPMGAPTTRPDQPITAGMGQGAAGLDGLAKAQEAGDLDRLKRYLPALVEMANRPDATPGFRNYVRLLRAKVG
jgi:hypothetical protein